MVHKRGRMDGAVVGCFLYLLCKWIGRRKVSVALTVDRWIRATANGVHLPVRVVIVYHVEVAMPAPEISSNIVIVEIIYYFQLLGQYVNLFRFPKRMKRVGEYISHRCGFPKVTWAFSESDLHQNG